MRFLTILSLASAATALHFPKFSIEFISRVDCSRPTIPGDTIKIHYRGTFTNGTEFDSSIGKEPLQFKLGAKQVIKGFDIGAWDMCPTDKRKVTIPPALGYGDKPRGPIPANSTLIFETQLVEIVGVPQKGH